MKYNKLPEGLQPGMQRYIEQGIEPGSFLRYVLENDLFRALGRADDQNRYLLWDICSWIYNEAPMDCWGNKEKVAAWISKGGWNCVNVSKMS